MVSKVQKIAIAIAGATIAVSGCSTSKGQSNNLSSDMSGDAQEIAEGQQANGVSAIACGPSSQIALDAAYEILRTSGLYSGSNITVSARDQVTSTIDTSSGYLINDTNSDILVDKSDGATPTLVHEGDVFLGFVQGEQPEAIEGEIPTHALRTRFDIQSSREGGNLGAVLQTRGPEGNPESASVFAYRGPTGFNSVLVSTSDADQELEITALEKDGSERVIPNFNGSSKSVDITPQNSGTVAIRVSDGNKACVAVVSNETSIDVPARTLS